MHTHHGLYADSLEKDEERDADRHLDLAKDKLTFTECIVALVIALTCVSLHAVFLGKITFRSATFQRSFLRIMLNLLARSQWRRLNTSSTNTV